MIIGIGIDIIEVSRIAAALRSDAFRQRVFTAGEQAYCSSRGKGSAASYAARFAGKEAVLKALGTGFSGGTWQDIEILPDDLGQPRVTLAGYFQTVAQQKGIERIFISLTHTREYAAAQVVMSGGEI
ncbi:MAG: holo-ACP synthase [Negativicutes bacterium]|nr:holo-ACP synthase [Negativicutes bacterium]